MKRKKLVALLLTASMLVCGCGAGGAKKSASKGTAKKTETTAKKTSAKEPGGKDAKTLTAFVMQSASGESGIWKGWGAQKLYDDLKLKINFDPTGSEVETKLQQYLVGGSLPDLVGLKALDQAQLAMNADMLLPLDQYKDKLPNIFNNENYKRAVQYSEDQTSNKTGHLYIMPTSVGPTPATSYNWVPLLQWDAYKHAGSPQPNTLEDYLDIVEKMVKYKPKTDKGEKTYGFSLFSDWDAVTALEVSTLSFMYGIDTEYVSPLMETNILTKKTTSLLADDSFYKRALKFYYEANQRGLMDPDSMSQTYSDMESKLNAGRVMFSWFSWLTGTYNSRDNTDNKKKVDGLGSVVAKDMKLYKAPDQTIGRDWYFAISKNCSDKDAALKLLNWLYDPEVDRYLTNGPQGVTWDYNDKKEPVVKEEKICEQPNEMLMPTNIGGGALRDGAYMFNSLGSGDAIKMDDGYTMGFSHWPSWENRDLSLMAKEVYKSEGGVKDINEYLTKNNMVAQSTQAVNMITPANDDLQIVITQIGEIVKKYSWQMVYAKNEDEFNSLWKTMTDQAKKLGLDKVTKYYTGEWDKALKLAAQYE